MIRNTTRNQKFFWVLFVLYLAAVIYFMFFSEIQGRAFMAKETYTYNLRPFAEIQRYTLYAAQIGWKGVFLNLIGNVIGFLPCGLFLPVISKRCREHWYNSVICAYLFSYFIEMSQLIFRAGSCDVDDILLNTFGGLLGYVLFWLVQHMRTVNEKRRRNGKKETL